MCPTQTPSFVWSASKVSRRRFTLHKPTTIVTSCPSTALEQLGVTRFRACWRGRGKASRRWLGRDGSSYSSLTPVDHHQVSTISRFVRGFKKRETRTTIPPTKPIHSRQNFFSPVSMRLARASCAMRKQGKNRKSIVSNFVPRVPFPFYKMVDLAENSGYIRESCEFQSSFTIV